MKLAVTAIALGGAVLAATAAAQPPTPQAPPQPVWAKMAYDAAGPNKVVKEAGGEACTIYRPETLGRTDRHPIVLWGNGTGQRPEGYTAILENLASWGFVVGAANTTNAGTAVEMLSCLDWLTAENSRDGSVYRGKLDPSKVGATGHSQGGGGALMAGRDPRVKTTAPIQPYTRGLGYVAGAQGLQHGPIMMTSGGADTIARPEANQQVVFDQANKPIFWATLRESSHLVPMRGGGVYPGIVTAWFRYQLMGDPKAAALFQGASCGYCTAADWTIQRKNNG